MNNPKELTLQEELDLFKNAQTDRESFGKLYEYYFPIIYRYVNIRVGFDKNTTEDLTQKVFLKILEHLEKIEADPKRGLKPYFYTVSRNVVIDYYRSNQKTKNVMSLEENRLIYQESEYLDEAISHEECEEVKKLVKTLAKNEQDIVALKFGMGLKHAEIAQMVGLTENHVGVIVHRLIKKIKNELEKGGQK